MQAPSLRLGNLIGSINFHNKISSRRKHQPYNKTIEISTSRRKINYLYCTIVTILATGRSLSKAP